MSHLSRRTFLKNSATALTVTLAGTSTKMYSKPAKPNILWICTDQQRWDTIHALGNPYIQTPNIDRLVETGVAFTHAHCTTPICTPSRANFLTGYYASTLHACTNGNDHWEGAEPLITKTLADIGYDCGLSGKFHLSAAHKRIEPRVDDGYRVFHWSHHPADDWPKGHDYCDWLESRGQDYNQLYNKYGYIPTPYHQTTWCTDMAIDFIKKDRSSPWLFSLNCFDPHPPFDPPQEYLDRFDVDNLPGPAFRESDLDAQNKLSDVNFQSEPKHPDTFNGKRLQAKYWAQIELIDDNVGRLLKTLEETGQRDNTLIIFTSDHGDMVGDHGLRSKGCRFYEGLVRVPLIFSWPARFEKNLKSEALVELTDIVPTLMQITGLQIPEDMPGQSLFPIVTGQKDPHHHRDYVRSEYYQTLASPPASYATMIRTKKYKLVNYHGHDLGELFDLEKDPQEFENLWDDSDYADVRFELMKKNFDRLAFAVDIGSKRVGRY